MVPDNNAGILHKQDTTKKVTRREFSVQQAVDYALKNKCKLKKCLLQIKVQNTGILLSAAHPHANASLGTT